MFETQIQLTVPVPLPGPDNNNGSRSENRDRSLPDVVTFFSCHPHTLMHFYPVSSQQDHWTASTGVQYLSRAPYTSECIGHQLPCETNLLFWPIGNQLAA